MPQVTRSVEEYLGHWEFEFDEDKHAEAVAALAAQLKATEADTQNQDARELALIGATAERFLGRLDASEVGLRANLMSILDRVKDTGSPAPPAPEGDYTQRMVRLVEPRDSGVLSPEEFEASDHHDHAERARCPSP